MLLIVDAYAFIVDSLCFGHLVSYVYVYMMYLSARDNIMVTCVDDRAKTDD